MRIKSMIKEDWCTGTVLQRLQERVATRYSVFPVDSYKAYEELTDGEGVATMIYRINFQAFVATMPGEATVDNVEKACDILWTEITQAFPGSGVAMWRTRPAIEVVDLAPVCDHCGQKSGEMPVTRVRLRLGVLT